MLRVPKDAEHLLRLALLFGAGIVIFLGVRAFLLPAGFGHGQCQRDGQRPQIFDSPRQGAAVDLLEDEIEKVALDADIEGAHEVRVSHIAGQSRLGAKTPLRDRVGAVGASDLERHRPAQLVVPGVEDHAVASAAQFLSHLIATADPRPANDAGRLRIAARERERGGSR